MKNLRQLFKITNIISMSNSTYYSNNQQKKLQEFCNKEKRNCNSKGNKNLKPKSS